MLLASQYLEKWLQDENSCHKRLDGDQNRVAEHNGGAAPQERLLEVLHSKCCQIGSPARKAALPA